jgi:hypothetical protein
MTHYIGMAGLHGCLSTTCGVYDTQKEAADSLADLHDLGRNRRRKLARDGYLELNIRRDGNEYAEITACACSTPLCGSTDKVKP